MTWTYTADPTNVPVDEVRLLIGDTDVNDQQLQDEEIQYYIDKYGPGVKAAIPAVQGLIAQCARAVDEKTGEIEVKFHQKLGNYKDLLAGLEGQLLTSSVPIPFAGGTSISDRDVRDADTDRVPDQFSVGMNDNNDFRP